MTTTHSIEWRGPIDNPELNALHAECFNHAPFSEDWTTRLHRHSLGWVTARHEEPLIGFVHVAWDGGNHAFVLDLIVKPAYQYQGLATRMMQEVVRRAKEAGCVKLHVDFEEGLRGFYVDVVGFSNSPAGVMRLT